jgi:hypothetical protein
MMQLEGFQKEQGRTSSPKALFSQGDLAEAAGIILRVRPDPIPAYRLLNEVLRLPIGDPELYRAKGEAERCQWVRELQDAQLPDGSWGRFHSQDTRVKSAFRTTEEAIDRAFSLGLRSDHPVLIRAQGYIENVLAGNARITDREEKSEAWPLLIKFILVGRLVQIDPTHALAEESRNYLSEVARQAFASGQYDLKDEARAFQELSGIQVPNGFLESKHALWILSSRPLPVKLEQCLLQWIWNMPDGIRYLRAPLPRIAPKKFTCWLRTMNLLRRFRLWREVSTEMLNALWNQRDHDGLWDFGSQPGGCIDFPLSESWRQSWKRKVDYSTCILALLRHWFD